MRAFKLIVTIILWWWAQPGLAAPYEVYFLQNDQKIPVTLPHVWTQNPNLAALQQGLYEMIIPPPWGSLRTSFFW